MKISRADLRLRLAPILLAQALGLACGIAGVRLASHWVAPADYGRYGVFVSLAPLGLGVVFAGVLKFVGRRWAGAGDRAALLRGVLAAIRKKTPWLAAAVAVAAVVAAPDGPVVFGTLLLVAALLLTLGQLAQIALQAERAHWPDFAIAGTAALTRSFLPPLAYAVWGASLVSLLAGFSLHAAVVATTGLALLRLRRTAPAGTTEIAPGQEYEGSLFISLAVAGWIVAGFNRWAAAWFFGAEQAGYFTLAANIAVIPPSLLGGVVLQYFQPVWFATSPQYADARLRLARDVDRIAAGYTLAALALAVALHAVMPWLIGPLVSERYAPAAKFVLGAACFMTAVSIGQLYHTLLIAGDRPAACGPVDLSGAGCLLAGGLVSAACGPEWFVRWLCFSPAVPWLVNRPLARRLLAANR